MLIYGDGGGEGHGNDDYSHMIPIEEESTPSEATTQSRFHEDGADGASSTPITSGTQTSHPSPSASVQTTETAILIPSPHVSESGSARPLSASYDKSSSPQNVPDTPGIDQGSITRPHIHFNLDHTPQPASSAPSSTHTSSTSLHALSEESELTQEHFRALPRASSAHSAHGGSRNRRISQPKSKSSPASRQNTVHTSNSDYPIYPDQSFSVLQPQPRSGRPAPLLRTHSSNPSQNSLYTSTTKQSRDGQSPSIGARTADNTPISSPGLFSPHYSHPPTAATYSADLPPTSSPRLHPTHLQTPKETHTVEIDHDFMTGNKLINSYEVLQVLGQGQYGKVKKGRDIENDMYVAIKIVPRYSRQRRLGKLGAAEDRVKKEVAILKKARHQNVVSLLEVIDDPNRHKVYIVLEFVEKGEIKWRTPGMYTEIITAYRKHLQREKNGVPETEEMREQDNHLIMKARRHREYRQRVAEKARGPVSGPFSLEHGEPADEEESLSEVFRSISRQTDRSNNSNYTGFTQHFDAASGHSLEPIPGSFFQDSFRGRAFSVAESNMSQVSSEFNLGDDDDDEHNFVPTLSLGKARDAFRDTLLGLEFLHFQGIIHRDIKPANLLEAGNGQIKISDFGVSYLGRPVRDEEENTVGETEAKTLDDPRELARTVGTPAFYAPELCSEDPSQFAGCEDGSAPKITGAIDLWALGITLYAMIYGRLPFYADDHLGLYEAICRSDVFLPRYRLKPAQFFEPHKLGSPAQIDTPIDSEKRPHHEYELEEVPESVRNLIASLLVKDPSMRMTIDNAKRHPWVVEDIENPGLWIAGTNPRAEGKLKIVVDDKDVSYGVVKRSLVERAISGVSRIAGSFLGRRESRKRATSSATSASASTESMASHSASSCSTVGKENKMKEGRRTSLRGDEIVAAALKASRDGAEHPLAQSQTASPVDKEIPSYFVAPVLNQKSASTGVTPAAIDERRPRGPERAISAVSTAESTKTIKASQYRRRPSMLDSSSDFGSPSVVEAATTSIGSIFSGAGRRLAGMRSRERRPLDSDRSPSSDRASSESDAHASPSLAVSTASASGGIETPEALRTASPGVGKSPPHLNPLSPSHFRRHSYYQPPESSSTAFEQAQEINQRRLLHEASLDAQKQAPQAEGRLFDDDCPPSPDDDLHFRKSMATLSESVRGSPMQTLPSASTIASSSPDEFGGTMSQSASNPSIPSVVSEASSLAADSFFPMDKLRGPSSGAEAEPPFMRTAETIKAHGRSTVVTSGRPLEEQGWYDDGDDEDASEDEGIMFGGPSKRAISKNT